MKKTLIIGHRGSPHHEPENTLKSFQKALDHGVDMIELDVHLTKDKKLIVMHDPNLTRMTGVNKQIRELTLKQIKKLKVRGETIPTLGEAIDFLKGKCMLNIESKVSNAAKHMVKLIKEKDIIDDVVVSSRSFIFLRNIKFRQPFIKTAWIFERPSIFYILRAKTLGLYSLQPHYNITTSRMVRRAHKHNLKVFIWWNAYPLWKVNPEKVKRLNPDGIITHDPKMRI